MPTIDRVKEEIGLLKLFLAALIAIDVSLIAWLAQNYGRLNRFLVLAGGAATLVITVGGIWVTRRLRRYIQELEDLWSQMEWVPIVALAIFLIGLGIMLWDATREIPSKTPTKSGPSKASK